MFDLAEADKRRFGLLNWPDAFFLQTDKIYYQIIFKNGINEEK